MSAGSPRARFKPGCWAETGGSNAIVVSRCSAQEFNRSRARVKKELLSTDEPDKPSGTIETRPRRDCLKTFCSKPLVTVPLSKKCGKGDQGWKRLPTPSTSRTLDTSACSL